MLQLLLPFQRLFIPGLILLLIWSSYRTVFKKDRALGLALYLGLVIIVDSFLNTGIYIPGFEVGSIRYSEICAFFLIINNPPSNKSNKSLRMVLFLLSLYMILFFISAFRGITVLNGLENFRRYFVPQIVAFLAAYRGFEKSEDYDRFMLYLMPLVIIIGLFTFWDVFFDRWILYSEGLHSLTYYSGRRNARFGSFFLNPNYMGSFAVLVFPVIFIRALIERGKLNRILCWLGTLSTLFALVETQSRSAMIGILVSVLTLIIIPIKKYSIFKKIVMFILLFFVFYLFMPGFVDHSVKRFSTIENAMSTEKRSRETIWEYTEKVIADNMLLGIGLGETKFIRYMYRYGFKQEFSSYPLHNPHNSYLMIAVHAGIPALVLFLLFNLVLIQKGISAIRKYNKCHEYKYSLYIAGLISGIVGFLVTLIPGGQLFTTIHIGTSYYLFCGVAVSIIYLDGKLPTHENNILLTQHQTSCSKN
jgi:O-antigen ligase